MSNEEETKKVEEKKEEPKTEENKEEKEIVIHDTVEEAPMPLMTPQQKEENTLIGNSFFQIGQHFEVFMENRNRIIQERTLHIRMVQEKYKRATKVKPSKKTKVTEKDEGKKDESN